MCFLPEDKVELVCSERAMRGHARWELGIALICVINLAVMLV